MELIRERMGRSEELRESVMVQMFSMRNESGRIRRIVRVTLIFEETKQEFFKDYLFEGWRPNTSRNTSPLELAEPAYINEVSKALKGGYRKVYSSLDSLIMERENSISNSNTIPSRNTTPNSNTTPNRNTTPNSNTTPNRNTLPKKVSILTKGSVSLDTMRAWKREMDYVYAGGEFA